MLTRRKLVGGALALAALTCAPAGWAQLGINLSLNFAPPPPQVEPIPQPRPGYVWGRGYWAWQGGSHVWVPGRWIAEHPGQHWVPEHWAQRGPNYVFVPGRWVPEQQEIVIGLQPPGDVVEQVPQGPPGYFWARGYWNWNGSELEWIGGHWAQDRPGYHWAHARWIPEPGGRWRFKPGHWKPN